MTLDIHDTIVARATASGVGARSIVRISGPHAINVARRLVEGAIPADVTTPIVIETRLHLLSWGRSIAAAVYVWPMRRSFTRQPTVEFHLPVTGTVVDAVESAAVSAGARRARPGEFTLRAFLAGRLDLAQAEAILGVIEARTDEQLREALDRRAGGLSKPIMSARGELLDLLADLEAGLDFVEEDIRFVASAEVVARLDAARSALHEILERLGSRALERSVPRAVLLGAPNAGKSSLFNALVGKARAIVSPIPGATRDYLAAEVWIGDRSIELVDTAGVADASDDIADAAARLRRQVVDAADLAILCVPIDQPAPDEWRADRRQLRVRTKTDLVPERNDPTADCHVSVAPPRGLDALLALVARRLDERDGAERSLASASARSRECLQRALAALAEARELAVAEDAGEVLAVPLRDAIEALGEIVGAVYAEDLLDRIFSRFCIGK